MTTYDVEINTSMAANADQATRARNSRYRLKETFSEFRTSTDGLTLPTIWKIQLNSDPGTGDSSVWEWAVAFTSIVHNQAVAPEVFDVH